VGNCSTALFRRFPTGRLKIGTTPRIVDGCSRRRSTGRRGLQSTFVMPTKAHVAHFLGKIEGGFPYSCFWTRRTTREISWATYGVSRATSGMPRIPLLKSENRQRCFRLTLPQGIDSMSYMWPQVGQLRRVSPSPEYTSTKWAALRLSSQQAVQNGVESFPSQ